MTELGKVFRRFRINKNYSLQEAAGDVVSVSQLSRFERGESDLSIQKFLAVLDNIYVNIENFMDATRNYQRTEEIEFMSKIVPLYYANDVSAYQELQNQERQKIEKDEQPLRHQLNIILIQGLICQRNSSYQMTAEDLDLVSDYLFQCEHWGMYEIILFANLYSFYNVDYVFRIAKEILERDYFYEKISKHYCLIVILTLNCWLHCLEHKAFEEAEYFEKHFEKIAINQTKIFEKTIALYIKGFKLYQEGNIKEGLIKMREAIHVFEVVDAPEQVVYYQEHFDKFVTIAE